MTFQPLRWNWFNSGIIQPEPERQPAPELSAQWARVMPSHVDEFDWAARLADGERDPLPRNMTWLHPAAGQET